MSLIPLSWRCAVLGDPIDHSLSPTLHNAAYAALGLDWTYGRHQVPAGGLAAFLASCDPDVRGLSLTMPLKREALPLVASMSPRARTAGAINTLVRTSYGWAGDNTDLPGAVAAIRERSDHSIVHAAILGAGATAASIGLAVAELGAEHVSILARHAERAGETVSVLDDQYHRLGVSVDPIDTVLENVDILVSTIPASAQTPDLVDRYRDTPIIFDAIYDPWPTPLASAATGAVVSGHDLLVHQAALQFELFTGQPAPMDAMRAALEPGADVMQEPIDA